MCNQLFHTVPVQRVGGTVVLVGDDHWIDTASRDSQDSPASPDDCDGLDVTDSSSSRLNSAVSLNDLYVYRNKLSR